ncbi:TPM domain-containing protein [Mesorhizobium sp. 1B3]|uniref:TPM domain-containing protein n=1 Tax=Mesorhizobium sp. 1B3 TaxID=3243599 RepID=UPI003D95B9C9
MTGNVMTRQEHSRIAEAIRAAEERTAGEIYCVVARSSDSYLFPAAFFVTAAMLLISLAVAWALHHWWFDPRPTTVVLAQLAAVACGLALLWFLPAMRIWFVPRRLRYRHAHANAVKQFLARNVHITEARTGVLLFVSLAERYAEVVADAGIDRRVDQSAWDGVVSTLVEHAAGDRLADGFVAAVGSVGALLEQHFPAGELDVNELDDHVVEI